MGVLPILLYPDPRLKTICDAIERFDESVLELARDLVDTMRAHPGCVGLAAPQIAVLRRMISVDVTGHRKAKSCAGLLLLANPTLLSAEGSEVGREGCLSIPDLTANVRRAKRIRVEARDEYGGARVVEANAFEARALLHEMDHLDGLLFLDRVASLTDDVFRRKVYEHQEAFHAVVSPTEQ